MQPLRHMHESLPPKAHTYPVTAARVISFAVLLALWASPSYAAQASAQFDVFISLGVPNADLCRSSTQIGSFGEAVVVTCSSGEIVDFSGDTSAFPWSVTRGDAYRFATLAPTSAASLGTVNSYAGLGPVSSWRKVNLAGRDYLELTISW